MAKVSKFRTVSSADVTPQDAKEGRGLIHEIKIDANALENKCRKAGVPMFIAYYTPDKGYQYNALLPEELFEEAGVESEYGKFLEFLSLVSQFRRAPYTGIPLIKLPKEE